MPETGKRAGRHARRAPAGRRRRRRAAQRARAVDVDQRGVPARRAADPERLLTAPPRPHAWRQAAAAPARVHFFSAGDPVSRTSSQAFNRVREAEIDRFRPYQERMNEVTSILTRDRALSCLFVDLSRLHRVELDLGVTHHSEIYHHAAAVLDRLRSRRPRSRRPDLPHRRRRRRLVFLARARARCVGSRKLSVKVERAIEDALAPMVARSCASSRGSPSARRARLGNSLLRPELPHRAPDRRRQAPPRQAARERKAHREGATLQDVILGDGQIAVYHPIDRSVPATSSPARR